MVKYKDRKVSAPLFFPARWIPCFGGKAVKLKKGISLILCLLFVFALAPQGALAVCDECVDGVWASVALTGGANKVIFSADGEIEDRILHPNEQTDALYIPPEGMRYDASTNTLYLTDFDGATANLVLTMMGADFTISLSGSSTLASIRSESKGRGGSIRFSGDGSLELVSLSDEALMVNAGGAADFVRIDPQVRLTVTSASGSAIRVRDTSLADGAIIFDTANPHVRAADASTELSNRRTTGDKTIDVCTCAGETGLFGLEADIDTATESLVFNIYRLEAAEADGRYPAELIEEKVADISAYTLVTTPHDWTVKEISSGATASSVRFARFTISAAAPGGNGTVSLSQTAIGRGGRVEVSTSPAEGYKLGSLTINDAPVQTSNGGYIIDGVTADLYVVAAFVEATPVNIAVSAPAATAFEVPADGAEAFVSEPFSAAVTDGAGDPVTASVVWSLAPETTGVSIGADGRVTVSNAAKSAAAEGTLDFTVSAAVGGTELSDASGAFTVALAARSAAAIRLVRGNETLGEDDTITIPAAGETESVQYAAVVLDQYGAAIAEEINWSASELPAGVSRDADTLTVSESCADGGSLVLTAAASSDENVNCSVTISLSAPAASGNDSSQSGEASFTLLGISNSSNAEASNAEASNAEASNVEASNAEASNAEASNAEASSAEASNVEANNAEASNVEANNAEASNAEASNVEASNVEASNAEASNAEASNAEASSAEASSAEASSAEASSAEASNAEASNVEANNAEANNAEASNAAASNAEASNAEASNAAASNAAASNAEASNAAASNAEASNAEVSSAAAPLITWPSYTLASDPVYGITWGQLVSFTGGSATLAGEALTGVFSLNRTDSALPNVSDSFKFVFSYLVGEEIVSVEEDTAHAVTLARKPIGAEMITLSPSETSYTGTAREPAVSLKDGSRDLISGTDFRVTAYSDNIEIGTGSVTIEGLGNYAGSASKNFTISAVPGSALTGAVVACKPEDEGTMPTISFKDGDTTLVEGKDYDLSLQYDIPAKTGTATVTFKGKYSGTRVISFDLPNYLITDGAGAYWSKSTSDAMVFRANGALGKFVELTVDGKAVPKSYYTTESGSTIVRLKADYLKNLTAGRHIIGIAFQDGKALAIFSVSEVNRRGVATGDENNIFIWIALMGVSLLAVGALAWAFVRSGKKKKKKKKKKTGKH